MSGFTSTWNSKVTGAPISHLRLWMCGSATGFNDSCSTATFQLAHQLLQRFLPDIVGEVLLHDRCRCLPLPEARQPRAALVGAGGAVLGLAHLLHGHSHCQ